VFAFTKVETERSTIGRRLFSTTWKSGATLLLTMM
jgi:hypothetical protein